MKRRLFTPAAFLSLLMFVATTVLWMRSSRAFDVKRFGDYFILSNNGTLLVGSTWADNEALIQIRYWKMICLFFALPALRTYFWCTRSKPWSDRCPVCSYNLTATTSGICPECGTPIPQTAEAKA